ncbi:beta-galactosidase domain 4-containing protein [Streptomyces sp. NPDC056948]|uniref:DUF4981 domain-containing protein n=1 Tax=Streptomyces sp. NPDC056948 TaxID=3345975 RepID=UPI0036318EB6
MEYQKVIEPVVIGPGGASGRIAVHNRYDLVDLSRLRFAWSLPRDGVLVDEGALSTSELGAGERAEITLPPLTAATGEAGERLLTVRAEPAKSAAWAPEGHQVAWGQIALPSSCGDTIRAGLDAGRLAADASAGLIALDPVRPGHRHTDHAVQGVGSGAVGPGVLPRYRLEVRPADFTFVLTALSAT